MVKRLKSVGLISLCFLAAKVLAAPSNGGTESASELLQPPSVLAPSDPGGAPEKVATPPAAATTEALPPGAPGLAACAPTTITDFENLALSNNPTIARASGRVQAAQGNFVQVGIAPNPTAGYSASEIGDEGQAGQQGGVVGQEFVLGGKLKLNRAVAAKEVQQAQLELDTQRQRVLNDVRVQFYNVLIAQQKVALADHLVGIGGQGVELTERLFKAQDVSKADVLQARIEANTARMLAGNAKNEQLSAWRTLAAVVGQPDMPMTTLTGDPHAGLPTIEWDEALQRILGGSPEVAGAQTGVERARWALSRAKAEPIPNVDLQVTLQHDNATHDGIVGVQAVLPIPLWNRNQGGICQAQGNLIAAENNVARVQLSLQQRLAVAYERYSNAKQQVERYEKDILPDAQTSLDLITEAYKQGEFNSLARLTAQRTYFQTNLAYLDALLQLRESSIEIDGMLLRGNLQSGE